MSEARMELLFDEFATRYKRGERPDVGEYLERAGLERGDLGRLIDRFLEAVPAREPTPEEIVLMQAQLEQQPPILLLRLRRKLSRDAVVSALVTTLGVDPAKSKKVGGYYHRLETGLLDPNRVLRLGVLTCMYGVRTLHACPKQRERLHDGRSGWMHLRISASGKLQARAIALSLSSLWTPL